MKVLRLQKNQMKTRCFEALELEFDIKKFANLPSSAHLRRETLGALGFSGLVLRALALNSWV